MNARCAAWFAAALLFWALGLGASDAGPSRVVAPASPVELLMAGLRLSPAQQEFALRWPGRNLEMATLSGFQRYLKPRLSVEQKRWLASCRLPLDGVCNSPECLMHGPVAAKLARMVEVKFEPTPLKDALAALATESKVKIDIDADVNQPRQLVGPLDVGDVPLEQALDLLLLPAQLHYRREADRLVVTPVPHDLQRYFRPATLALAQALEQRVNASFRDQPLGEALAYLEQTSGARILVQTPDAASVAARPVNLATVGVSLGELLTLLLEPQSLTFEADGGFILVLARKAGTGLDDAPPKMRWALRRGADVNALGEAPAEVAAYLAQRADLEIEVKLAPADELMTVSLKVQAAPLRLILQQLVDRMTAASRAKCTYEVIVHSGRLVIQPSSPPPEP